MDDSSLRKLIADVLADYQNGGEFVNLRNSAVSLEIADKIIEKLHHVLHTYAN